MELAPVIFRFPRTLAPDAHRVAVVGPFNRWDPSTHLLTKTPEGDWSIKIYLTPGNLVYGFYVDGTFWLDPCDEGRVLNCWGSEYSVRNVGGSPPAP